MEPAVALGVFMLMVAPIAGGVLTWLFDQIRMNQERPDPPETNQMGRNIPGGDSRNSQ
ncbi:hypothetical protein [Halovenus marina]|uniref:hypothetical protein n=1 Tax=Halovenus marina TaxID=3396621 RepID=UPI003F5458D6